MGIISKIFGSKQSVDEQSSVEETYSVPCDNKRMDWAIEKAGLTLHYFKSCLEEPKPKQQYFSAKARIEDNGVTEHIWLLDPAFDEQGNVFGIIGNEPNDVTNVQKDQKVGISEESVSDWMIIENDRLIGGYTIRALREGLSGEKLQDFDKKIGGMLIDEGEDYFKPNFDTPEGAILALENAYDEKDLQRAMDCKNFKKEAQLLLEKSVGIHIDQDIIESTAEILRLSYINDLNENGMPVFTDIKRAFERTLISENHYIITEICTFPDGRKSSQRLNVYKMEDGWKVLGPEKLS